MKTNIAIILSTLLCFLSACVEDEGNYTYTPVNEVSVNGIDERYNALAYSDVIEIAPEIEGSVKGEDMSNYEFAWYRCYSNHTHDTISREKDLHWKADIQPGSYTLYLGVKDKDTGYNRTYSTTLNISSPYTRGFLILGNRPNTGNLVGLDMLTMVPGRDTVYVQDVFDNSKLQLKNAKSMSYTGYYSRMTQFFISTEETTHKFSFTDTFEPIAEFNDLKMIEPLIPHKRPIKLIDVAMRQGVNAMYSYLYPRIYLTEDYAFGCRPSASEYMSEPFNRYSQTSEDFFRFYPYIFYNQRKGQVGYSGSSASPVILYDLDNECFSYLAGPYQMTYMKAFQNSPSHGVWMNCKPYYRTIVYGENDFTTGNTNCNAIMKESKPGEDVKYLIYRFVPEFSMSGGTCTIKSGTGKTYNLDLSVMTDFLNAEHYYFASAYTLLYYSVGNTIYAYDYVNNKLASKQFDGKITYLQAEASSDRYNNKWFWVATFDGTKGHLYKMVTSVDPNKIEFIDLPNNNWEVNLEVKSVLWKGQNSW